MEDENKVIFIDEDVLKETKKCKLQDTLGPSYISKRITVYKKKKVRKNN